jgi:hypothetical protein
MTKAGEAIKKQVLAQLAHAEAEAEPDKTPQTQLDSEVVWLRRELSKANDVICQLYLAKCSQEVKSPHKTPLTPS